MLQHVLVRTFWKLDYVNFAILIVDTLFGVPVSVSLESRILNPNGKSDVYFSRKGALFSRKLSS